MSKRKHSEKIEIGKEKFHVSFGYDYIDLGKGTNQRITYCIITGEHFQRGVGIAVVNPKEWLGVDEGTGQRIAFKRATQNYLGQFSTKSKGFWITLRDFRLARFEAANLRSDEKELQEELGSQETKIKEVLPDLPF